MGLIDHWPNPPKLLHTVKPFLINPNNVILSYNLTFSFEILYLNLNKLDYWLTHARVF